MTDAEFLLWLKAGAANRVILAELTYAYEVGGAVQTNTVYLADAPFATGSAETPASVAYYDAILAVPNFSRQIDRDTLGGRAQYTIGSLELDNADGRLDYLLDLIVDGHEASFLLGGAGWARADFREVFVATMLSLRATETRITIALTDSGSLLNKRVEGLVIGGTGPNAGVRRPLVFGVPMRVEAVPADGPGDNNLRFFVGSDLTGASITVRDNGALIGRSFGTGGAYFSISNGAIDADNDTITYNPHNLENEDVIYLVRGTPGSGPTSNPQVNTAGAYYWVRNVVGDTFKLSETRTGSMVDFTNGTFSGTLLLIQVGFYPYTSGANNGAIDLAHSPVDNGLVTVDYTIGPTTGYAVGESDTFSGIIKHLVTIEAGFPLASFIGEHPATAIPMSGVIGLVAPEQTNVLDLLDQLVASLNGFWAMTRAGGFQYGRIYSGLIEPATYTVADDDVVRGSVALERVQPRYSRFSCVYDKNWTPQQTGLAGVLTPDEVAYATGPGITATTAAESGTSYALAPSLYHKTISAGPTVDTLLKNSAAQYLSLEKARWAPHLEFITLDTHLGFYQVELGDPVDLDLGVLGLTNVSTQVVGIDLALSDTRMRLTLTRQRIPVHPAFSIDVSWAEMEAPT